MSGKLVLTRKPGDQIDFEVDGVVVIRQTVEHFRNGGVRLSFQFFDPDVGVWRTELTEDRRNRR